MDTAPTGSFEGASIAPVEPLLAAVLDLSKDLDLRPLLHRLVTTAADLTDAEYGALGILDAHGGFDDIVVHGISPEVARAIGEGPHGKGVLGTIIHRPQTLRVADISQHPDSVGFPAGHPPMTSFLGCPVVIRGEVFGNLYLTNKRSAPEFTESDERILEVLATAAASAIAHSRRFTHTSTRERWQRAAATCVDIVASEPARQAWPHVVDVLEDVLETDHAEHIPPYRTTTRLGEVAERLHADRRAMVLTPEETTSVLTEVGVDLGRATAILVPVNTDDDLAGSILLAWSEGPTLGTRSLESFGQHLADRLTVAAVLAHRQAEAERVAILEDRDRIAQDLHDHVIQRLFAAGMRVQGALTLTDDAALVSKLDAVVTDLDDTVKDVRRAIFELHEGNAALGLAHSIEMLADSAADALGFRPSVAVVGDYWTLEDALVADVLAVTREALSNAARHAHARSVRVVLDVTDDVVVKVTDDGVGIPDDPPRCSGVSHLKARAERWGGECEIRRRRMGGTIVLWKVPHRRNR